MPCLGQTYCAPHFPLKLQFDRRVRLDFRGATITSDAGLLACRELDAALGLTETANDYIHESRTGRNVQHRLLPLLRQSVYSRLAGYEDTNDAERLAQDPAMRVIVGWQGTDKQAASTNTMSHSIPARYAPYTPKTMAPKAGEPYKTAATVITWTRALGTKVPQIRPISPPNGSDSMS